MTMTDLGVECVVGLCMAAAIWWVARRRCRSHTEEPKVRLESADPAKAMALADDAAVAAHDALLAEGDTTSEADDDDSSVHSLDEQHQQHQQEDASTLNEGEDDDDDSADDDDDDDEEDEAAETDVTEHGDGDDQEAEEAEEDNNEERPLIDEKMMEETMARAMAMAANMGVNMSESFMAMEEFLVLDTPQPAAAAVDEVERMRMEDPASFVHLDDADIDTDDEEDDDEDEQEEEEEEENEEELERKEEKESVGGEEAQGVMQAFWAKCEYKDECNLCHTPFSFLVRRHHCRKCCASVCSGCSSNSAALEEFGGSVERVCDRCWALAHMPAADDRRQEEDQGTRLHHGDADGQQDFDGGDDNEAEEALSS